MSEIQVRANGAGRTGYVGRETDGVTAPYRATLLKWLEAPFWP